MPASPGESSYDSIPDFGLLYDSVPAYAARGDVAFYVDEAKRAGGPVLKLGCGTGRILLPIARAGCTVTGLDGSDAMLERCSAKIHGDFDRTPLAEYSPEQVVLAERIL